MIYFPNTPVGRFRLIAVVEGISYLVLLFIAMPLKYLFQFKEAVTYTGWVHGIFFMLYILTLINASSDKSWPFRRSSYYFLLSFVPFGSFVVDRRLFREEKEVAIEEAPKSL